MKRFLKSFKTQKFLRFSTQPQNPEKVIINENITPEEQAIINEIDKKKDSTENLEKPGEQKVKTVEEIKAEIEEQERRLKELQEVEVLLRATIYRGLRATIFAVLAFAAFFVVLQKRGKDSRFLKFLEEKFKKNDTEEKSKELIQEMKEGGFPNVEEKKN